MFQGLITLPWWGYLLVTLALTHVTIAAVTIFLHRHQAHRALDLHPLTSHFFRFWLWLTTGLVTKEWVAVHRKHHAKVDGADDPHSPQHFGLKKVLLEGTELYRTESCKPETLAKYGHATPDDWLERNVYSRHSVAGIALMLAIDVILFGAIGLTIWAVQMMWIPFFAAGVINGVAHYWGYRNFESDDASRNLFPWGILIGGDELHNNHHAFPGSAKMSAKWWELDIGWVYIRILEALRLARVKATLPKLGYDRAKQHIDLDTVSALIAARLKLVAQFKRHVLQRLYAEALRRPLADRPLLKQVKRDLVTEPALLDAARRRSLHAVLASTTHLRAAYAMKERLHDLWQRSWSSHEQLRQAIETWCRQAEETGIEALSDFSRRLRGLTLAR